VDKGPGSSQLLPVSVLRKRVTSRASQPEPSESFQARPGLPMHCEVRLTPSCYAGSVAKVIQNSYDTGVSCIIPSLAESKPNHTSESTHHAVHCSYTPFSPRRTSSTGASPSRIPRCVPGRTRTSAQQRVDDDRRSGPDAALVTLARGLRVSPPQQNEPGPGRVLLNPQANGGAKATDKRPCEWRQM
jgi:hypothetical protein